MTTVVITQNDDIEKAISEALNHILLEPLVRDRVVAVKPNETWVTAEDKTAVTQPDTLRAVLRQIKRFGPRELVVSGGRSLCSRQSSLLVVAFAILWGACQIAPTEARA